MKYKTILLTFLLSLLSSTTYLFGQKPSDLVPDREKIKVYLLGTFHFQQTDESYDVRSPEHQKSIQELCDIIAKQVPDKVFIEVQPEFESTNKLKEKYQKYYEREGLASKAANEIVQVGFRLAKMLGHQQVYQCDHPGMYGMHYQKTEKYAKKHGQMDILDAKAKGTIMRYDDLVDEDSIMKNSTLLDYMRWINSDAVMNTSHANYITAFTQIGSTNYYDYEDDDTLIGAELVADWYRRNILIYTKMINQLDYTEDAIFLIIGGDHVPTIRNLFRDNPLFELVHPREWLEAK